MSSFCQEDEDFPNVAETVILKDTWSVVSKQVPALSKTEAGWTEAHCQ